MPQYRPSLPETTPAVAVIIAAYNEGERISEVLGVLSGVDWLSEIIVVDDGSLDATAERVRDAARRDGRIQLIQHPLNLGKGQAIFKGLAESDAPYILLLDADLVGLTPEHIKILTDPVLRHEASMTLGLFRGGHVLTDLSQWLTPWLTGQRCLERETFGIINREAARRYGFETALAVAASQYRIRSVAVFLHGVWHPTSENHRADGLTWRSRMYIQIVHAWYLAGGLRDLRIAAKRKLPVVFLIVVLALFGLRYSTGEKNGIPGAAYQTAAIRPLSVTDFRRILIIAPHPDDETLGPGGLLQIALANGSQVRVVVVTNGDGQRLGPTILAERIDIKPNDYVKIGERRQAESVAALSQLGLPRKDAIYLGYPDRGISSMWLEDWNIECPYRSRYTKVTRNPYPSTFHPQAVYCGKNLLADLGAILGEFQPDLIVLPHPADQNLDHRAASNFVRLALAQTYLHDPSYQPQAWGYVVHYGSFPQPRGRDFGGTLLPPKQLLTAEGNWGQLSLTARQVQAKYRAIEAYPSQTLLLGGFLPSFARENELFEPLSFLYLPSGSYRDLPLLSAGPLSQTDQPQVSVQLTEDLPIRGNAILGWQVARLNNLVWVRIQTRSENIPTVKHILQLKLPNGTTQSLSMSRAGALFPEDSYVVQLDLAKLNFPDVLCLSAQVQESRFPVTQTGWHILILTP